MSPEFLFPELPVVSPNFGAWLMAGFIPDARQDRMSIGCQSDVREASDLPPRDGLSEKVGKEFLSLVIEGKEEFDAYR